MQKNHITDPSIHTSLSRTGEQQKQQTYFKDETGTDVVKPRNLHFWPAFSLLALLHFNAFSILNLDTSSFPNSLVTDTNLLVGARLASFWLRLAFLWFNTVQENTNQYKICCFSVVLQNPMTSNGPESDL